MLNWMRKILSRAPAPDQAADAHGIEISTTEVDTIYAIGDIHGRLDLLKQADLKIEADIQPGERALAIYLGDYIDRGPDSCGVLEHLRGRESPGFSRLCLRGNHDDVFLNFLERPVDEWAWLDLGGRETLRSYGLTLDPYQDRALGHDVLVNALRTHVPSSHRDFVAGTPLWARWGHFLFVHAGIQPGIPLDRQDPLDFMWIREPFLTEGSGLPMTVIHGHTPGASVAYGRNRIGIDTGAYATGRLTVLKVSDGRTAEL